MLRAHANPASDTGGEHRGGAIYREPPAWQVSTWERLRGQMIEDRRSALPAAAEMPESPPPATGHAVPAVVLRELKTARTVTCLAPSPRRFARRAVFPCSHRPVAGPSSRSFPVATSLWPVHHRSVFLRKKNGPTGPWLQPWLHLLELTHDRCTRFRLGKANRLRMQQARL